MDAQQFDPRKEKNTLMNAWQHVGVLRQRLLEAMIALAVTTLLSFLFTQQIIRLLAQPIGGLEKLQAIAVTENIGVFMRVALLSGFILALPFILVELVIFIWPALEKPGERTWVILGIPAATFLFVGGVLFSYFVMMPAAIPFLTQFLGVTTVPRISDYIDFVTNLMFWIGVCFETPLFIFLLAKLGLVSAGQLARHWRIAVVVISIIAAVATPTPDPVNMGLLMLPLLALYVLSIGLAKIAQPKES